MFDTIAKKSENNIISAENLLLLHTMYGFPHDLSRIRAEEKGMKVDLEGFKALMKKVQDDSRLVQTKGINLKYFLILFSSFSSVFYLVNSGYLN